MNTTVGAGPVYDPSKTFQENQAAGAVLRPGNGSLPRPGYINGKTTQVLLLDPTQNIVPVNTNPNWGKATATQPVRSFRFSVRYTF